MSDVWALDPAKKYFFCRRLLSGAARLAVESEADVRDYVQLKDFLKENFDVKVNGDELHSRMRTTRINKGESCVEYAYRMKRLASLGEVDNQSLLNYIIVGLGGVKAEKITLYEAADFTALRKKLVVFDKVRTVTDNARPQSGARWQAGPSTGLRTSVSASAKADSPVVVKREKTRCFKCNGEGHIARECPNPVRCYRCQAEGHRSTECPRRGPDIV